MEYKCKECGSTEFISQLNNYDIYKSENEKIELVNSEKIDEKLILYCRNCSKELKFDENIIVM